MKRSVIKANYWNYLLVYKHHVLKKYANIFLNLTSLLILSVFFRLRNENELMRQHIYKISEMSPCLLKISEMSQPQGQYSESKNPQFICFGIDVMPTAK